MGGCASSVVLEKHGMKMVVKQRSKNLRKANINGGGGVANLEGSKISLEEMDENVSLCSQQGKKGPNQDAVVFYQDYGVVDGAYCGVFDGHGQYGHFVSKKVRDCLPLFVLNQWNSGVFNEEVGDMKGLFDVSSSNQMINEWKEAIVKAFIVMDKELRLQNTLDLSYSGTTAVTIIKQGNDLIIANLGDSRAVLGTMNEDGCLTAVQLTMDLKPNVPQEAERIKKCNGRIFALPCEPHVARVWLPKDNFPGLAMARAFGDLRMKNYGIIAIPQVSHWRVGPKDQFIILATDGIWDVLSNQKAVNIAMSAANKGEAAKMVVDAAVREWCRRFPTAKMDDCSAICLFFHKNLESQQSNPLGSV